MRKSINIKASQIMALVESQEFKCALTGRDLSPANATMDHCIPLSRGGEHILSNLMILDEAVNKAKGNMTTEEFVGMCRQVIEWHDNQRIQQSTLKMA